MEKQIKHKDSCVETLTSVSQPHNRNHITLTLARPIVEYAATVWDPYTRKDIPTLDMVQRRGARYVCNQHGNRSSVDNMLTTHLNGNH